MKFSRPGVTRRLGVLTLCAGALVGFSAGGSQAADPVTLRIAADLTGPPHPAGIAMEYFKERLAEEIPGSEVRTYFAGALYRIPEAIEAMTDGNLEMTWGQFGKSSQIEPYASVVIGPQLLTTPGAINALDSFETFKMLQDRFATVHDVKIFASAHLSMYMGAGAGFRLLKPEDFENRKIRSMGPAENAALKAWGANPTTMAFGDVPAGAADRRDRRPAHQSRRVQQHQGTGRRSSRSPASTASSATTTGSAPPSAGGTPCPTSSAPSSRT